MFYQNLAYYCIHSTHLATVKVEKGKLDSNSNIFFSGMLCLQLQIVFQVDGMFQ